jgi:hypothetical protein
MVSCKFSLKPMPWTYHFDPFWGWWKNPSVAHGDSTLRAHGESPWDNFAGTEQSGWIQWHIIYMYIYILYIHICSILCIYIYISIIMCVLRYTLKSETHGLHFAWYQWPRLSMLGGCPCTVPPRLSCVVFHQGSSRKWSEMGSIDHPSFDWRVPNMGLPWFTLW